MFALIGCRLFLSKVYLRSTNDALYSYSENLEQQIASRKKIEHLVLMPNIRLNYEVKVNPNLFETLTHFTHWLNKYIKNPKYFEFTLYDFCVYMAYCYPEATTKQLLSISEVMVWAFVGDDQVMEQFKTYEEAMVYVNKLLSLWDEQDLEKTSQFCTYGGILMGGYQLIAGKRNAIHLSINRI